MDNDDTDTDNITLGPQCKLLVLDLPVIVTAIKVLLLLKSLLLLLLLLLSLLSQSLLVFFLCISRAQTMHLERQSHKSIILFIIIIIIIIIIIAIMI